MQEILTWGSLIQTLSVGEKFPTYTHALSRMGIIGLIDFKEAVTTQELTKLAEGEEKAADASAKRMAAQTRKAFDSTSLKHRDEDQDATCELPPEEHPHLAFFLRVICNHIEKFGIETQIHEAQSDNKVLESSEMSILRNALY